MQPGLHLGWPLEWAHATPSASHSVHRSRRHPGSSAILTHAPLVATHRRSRSALSGRSIPRRSRLPVSIRGTSPLPSFLLRLFPVLFMPAIISFLPCLYYILGLISDLVVLIVCIPLFDCSPLRSTRCAIYLHAFD